jgi:hypothetical protein
MSRIDPKRLFPGSGAGIHDAVCVDVEAVLLDRLQHHLADGVGRNALGEPADHLLGVVVAGLGLGARDLRLAVAGLQAAGVPNDVSGRGAICGFQDLSWRLVGTLAELTPLTSTNNGAWPRAKLAADEPHEGR